MAATSASIREHEVLQHEVLLGRDLALVDLLRPLLERQLDAERLVDREGDVEEGEGAITPESHAIDDLGIDFLAFLDIAFAIDKAFGIKLPLEQWTQEVNEGEVPPKSISS